MLAMPRVYNKRRICLLITHVGCVANQEPSCQLCGISHLHRLNTYDSCSFCPSSLRNILTPSPVRRLTAHALVTQYGSLQVLNRFRSAVPAWTESTLFRRRYGLMRRMMDRSSGERERGGLLATEKSAMSTTQSFTSALSMLAPN